jgi:hypothetical protein
MLNEIERLKIGLMVQGMNVSSEARKAIEGSEKRPMTLAEYSSTSGISMGLPENIWVNAPIQEYNPNLVLGSPHTLMFRNGRFSVLSKTEERERERNRNKTNSCARLF